MQSHILSLKDSPFGISPDLMKYKSERLRAIKLERSLQDCQRCNNILIIDDNSFNISALQVILDQINPKAYTSDCAGNGLQGLQQMEKKL
jgi:hypothetical protein